MLRSYPAFLSVNHKTIGNTSPKSPIVLQGLPCMHMIPLYSSKDAMNPPLDVAKGIECIGVSFPLMCLPTSRSISFAIIFISNTSTSHRPRNARKQHCIQHKGARGEVTGHTRFDIMLYCINQSKEPPSDF